MKEIQQKALEIFIKKRSLRRRIEDKIKRCIN